MHGGRRAGNDFIYRGAQHSSQLTQGKINGVAQNIPGLLACVGNRAVLWFGPKKMSLAYLYGNGVLGEINLAQLLEAAKNQNCDLLVFNRAQVGKHQSHLWNCTDGAANFYKKQMIPAKNMDVSNLRSACEFAVILPEGETVLRLPKDAIKYSHGEHFGSRKDKTNHATCKAKRTHPGDYHHAVLKFSGEGRKDAYLNKLSTTLKRLREQLKKIHDSYIQLKDDWDARTHNEPITNICNELTRSVLNLQQDINTKREYHRHWEKTADIQAKYLKLCSDIDTKLNPFLQKEEKKSPPNITLKKPHQPKQVQQPPESQLDLDYSF